MGGRGGDGRGWKEGGEGVGFTLTLKGMKGGGANARMIDYFFFAFHYMCGGRRRRDLYHDSLSTIASPGLLTGPLPDVQISDCRARFRDAPLRVSYRGSSTLCRGHNQGFTRD